MKSQDIRRIFQNYFSNQGHTWVPSASLIPPADLNLLFTNAGMNQFKDCFLGLKPPPAPQVCSIQKCMRAGGKHNDLEQVGFSPYHHTFFEMMGNFSFGSYNKKAAIDYAMNFLTKELGLSKDKLWVSVFKKDMESVEIWKKAWKIPDYKIFHLGEKDNFWRMGASGPCGPCSEIYYYDGIKTNPKPEDMTEIWNLVFMEFNEDSRGQRQPLPKLCIDTGVGLERLTTILQKKTSNYQTDLFKGIINALEEASEVKYDFTKDSQKENQTILRIIADHSRAISFLICDGILPGSDGQSYVLRRILRRAIFYSQKLKSKKNLLSVAAHNVIHLMGDIYPELHTNKRQIDSTIENETQLFTENLRMGKSILLQKIKNLSTKVIDDLTVWDLYSTYGFPPDLTQLIAKEKGYEINPHINIRELTQKNYQTSFQKETFKQRHKELINQINPHDPLISTVQNKKTEFTGYKKHEETAKILFCIKAKESNLQQTQAKPTQSFKVRTEVASTADYLSPLTINQKGWLLMDKTCFYPEGGGPVGDKGMLETKTGTAQIMDTQKRGNFIFHEVKIIKGEVRKDQECKMEVDKNTRLCIAANHSATHLLNQALRKVLGSSVRQMGSLVDSEKLRFDFSYFKPLTSQQVKDIENTVINNIKAGYPVTYKTTSYKEAINEGALSLAGENYEQKVRVIQMGESLELCGGIHVNHTSEINGFKIISETGVQSGVRRIVAYTNEHLKKWSEKMQIQNKELRRHLNMPIPEKPESINPFISWFKEKEEEMKSLKDQLKNLRKNPESDNQRSLKNTIFKKSLSGTFDFLVQQNLELRQYLNIPLPKDFTQEKNPFLPLIRKKEDEIKSLKGQLNHLSNTLNVNQLIKTAKPFQYQGIKGHLLNVILPIEDRKLLAETTDQLKSRIATPSIVIALGKGENQYPIVVTVSKELQKHISAGEILKNTIAPFLNGKGGGQARFAQGTVTEKPLSPELEKLLLKTLKEV